MTQLAILGGGRLAEVIGGLLLRSRSAEIKVWTRSPERREALRGRLPGLPLVDRIEDAARDADLVLFAVPVTALESVAAEYGAVARGDQIVIHGHRGTGPAFELPHAIIRRETCIRKIVAIGGPMHSRELSTERILAISAGSRFEAGLRALRALVAGTPIRVHPTRDLVGVEVAGAISNVAALATGLADGLALGETSRGLLLMRGLIEAQRIGVALGAEPGTFLGLAGLGELVPRKVSSVERHTRLGVELASGTPLQDCEAMREGSIEGVVTALAFDQYPWRKPLRAPLVRCVASILRGQVQPLPALEALLATDLDDPIQERAVRAEAR